MMKVTNKPMRPKEYVLSAEISGSSGTKLRSTVHKLGMALTMQNGTTYNTASETMPNQ